MTRLLDEATVETQIVSNRIHPTFSSGAVIGESFHDGFIEFLKSKFPMRAAQDGIANENHVWISGLRCAKKSVSGLKQITLRVLCNSTALHVRRKKKLM